MGIRISASVYIYLSVTLSRPRGASHVFKMATPTVASFPGQAQTVSTRPLFGGEWPGNEATPTVASFPGQAQTVSTRPLFGGEWPGNEATPTVTWMPSSNSWRRKRQRFGQVYCVVLSSKAYYSSQVSRVCVAIL